MIEFDVTNDQVRTIAKLLIYQHKVKVCDCDCPCNCLEINKFEGDVFGFRITLADRVVEIKGMRENKGCADST